MLVLGQYYTMTMTPDTDVAANSELRRLLMDWDLLGISDEPACLDEYDCMIDPLLEQLSSGASQSELQAWIASQVKDHFGTAISPNQIDEARLARHLVSWWGRRTAN